MSNYQLEEKEAFTVLGVGVELKSNYDDFAGIDKEKKAFEQKAAAEGLFTQLKSIAKEDNFYSVNKAYNNKMMYYFGVATDQTLDRETRNIEFPAGKYLVIKGSAANDEDLRAQLTYAAFGSALNELTDYAYVGGPNAVVITDHKDDTYYGEILIPLVKTA